MNDYIEKIYDAIDTAFENGAFDGRYAYENLIDAIRNIVSPLEEEKITELTKN